MYLATLLNWINNLSIYYFCISMTITISPANKDICILWSTFIFHISLSCFIVLARITRAMMTRSGIVACLFSFSYQMDNCQCLLIKRNVLVGFTIFCLFFSGRKIPSIRRVWSFFYLITKVCWILSNVYFCIYWIDHTMFFFNVLIWQITLIDYF